MRLQIMMHHLGVIVLLQTISTVLCVTLVEFKLDNGDSCYHTSIYSRVCYTTNKQTLKWENVQTFCQGVKGNFSVVKDQATQDIVTEIMKISQITEAYIGAKLTKTVWSWTNKASQGLGGIKYWDTDRPKPSNSILKNDCGTMVPAKNYKWIDTGCSAEKYFVCQADMGSSTCTNSSVFDIKINTTSKCLLFKHTSKTAYAAEEYCKTEGATLAWIDSTEIYNALIAEAPGLSSSVAGYWIGLARSSWVWYNGDAVEKSFWGVSEPGVGECIVEKKFDADAYTWAATDCSNILAYFCQIEAPKHELATTMASTTNKEASTTSKEASTTSKEATTSEMTTKELGITSKATEQTAKTSETSNLDQSTSASPSLTVTNTNLGSSTSSNNGQGEKSTIGLGASTDGDFESSTSSNTGQGENSSSINMGASTAGVAVWALSLAAVLIGIVIIIGSILLCQNKKSKVPSDQMTLYDEYNQPQSKGGRSAASMTAAMYISDDYDTFGSMERPNGVAYAQNDAFPYKEPWGSSWGHTSSARNYMAWKPTTSPMPGLVSSQQGLDMPYKAFHWRPNN